MTFLPTYFKFIHRAAYCACSGPPCANCRNYATAEYGSWRVSGPASRTAVPIVFHLPAKLTSGPTAVAAKQGYYTWDTLPAPRSDLQALQLSLGLNEIQYSALQSASAPQHLPS